MRARVFSSPCRLSASVVSVRALSRYSCAVKREAGFASQSAAAKRRSPIGWGAGWSAAVAPGIAPAGSGICSIVLFQSCVACSTYCDCSAESADGGTARPFIDCRKAPIAAPNGAGPCAEADDAA